MGSEALRRGLAALAMIVLAAGFSAAEQAGGKTSPAGLIPRFEIGKSGMHLSRAAMPGTYFDKVGRRFALLGFESGTFEAWAWPLKLLRNFEFSFLIGPGTTPINGRDIVKFIDVEPEATTLTFVWQSFTVRAHYVTDIDEAGAVILLEVDSSEPLTIICGFLPVLQPMWPAGLGGQYAYWDDGLKAYLISEPTRRNHAYVGSPAAGGISYTPAHMLSDSPNEFKIDVPKPAETAPFFLPVIVAGGKGERDAVKAVYGKLAGDPEGCYRRARAHYEALRNSTPVIETPVPEIDLAFEWAKVSLDNLLVDNPDLGRGLVAGLGASGTGGRPGFGWFFGGDAYLNSFGLNDLGMFEMTKEALEFTAKWQRKDGKMAHELSQSAGYIKWWEDYPYGYIHGDTTPYYLVAVGDYYRRTGDVGFIKAAWKGLLRAYEWCLTTDDDGDGLMDNSKAGLGALEFGSLTDIRTDIYLAAVWTEAARAMKTLSAVVGDGGTAASAEAAFVKASKAWNGKFWDEETGRYSFAFGRDGGLVRELTPWSSVGLAWGLGEPARAASTLSAINSPELATDWGVRMLSEKSRQFEPLNYNYGACWPFLSGWSATAMFRTGFVSQGLAILAAGVSHTFDNSLGVITELFSGARNVWPQEGVPHQGFSTTGVVLAMARGLLGMDVDVPGKEIFLEPAVPPDWPGFSVRRWKAGTAELSVDYEKGPGLVRLTIGSTGSGGFRAVVRPCLAPGSRVVSVIVNGKPSAFTVDPSGLGWSTRVDVRFALSVKDIVEIRFAQGLELVPPVVRSRTGDASRGIRILRTDAAGDIVMILVAGPVGGTGELELLDPGVIKSLEGAVLEGRELRFKFPGGKCGEQSVAEIKAELKR